MRLRDLPRDFAIFSTVLLLFSGCGGGDTSPSTAGTGSSESSTTAAATSEQPAAASTESDPAGLPTASIGQQKPINPALEEGSPEWYLKQIRETRLAAIAPTDDLAKLREIRRERNDKIVELASEVIAQTHDKPEQEAVFTIAASEFMEARLQNALQGGEEEIEELYGEAAAFDDRDPESDAAMLAGYALVRFAHTNAQRYAAKEPRWIDEFSKQARLFASKYPKEETKILPLLSAAAMTCELHGKLDDAKQCYTILAEQFPETPHGRNSTGVLRRLSLVGTLLEFAGPTPDGGFVSMENFQDKILLVVFWSSDNEEFAEQFPLLKSIYEKYNKFGFEVVCVCMDEDEPALNAWLEEHSVPWKQVFFADPKQRRWQNPVAQYYGVRTIPTYWLADHAGIVKSTDAKPAELEPQLRDLLLVLREKGKNVSANE